MVVGASRACSTGAATVEGAARRWLTGGEADSGALYDGAGAQTVMKPVMLSRPSPLISWFIFASLPGSAKNVARSMESSQSSMASSGGALVWSTSRTTSASFRGVPM